MLGFLKQIFTAEERPLQLDNPIGSLVELSNGRFSVVGLETTYARKRDAIRGAKRRGLTVIA